MTDLLMWPHIALGTLALAAGTVAVVARKGGRLHSRAGTWFFGTMVGLGATITLLSWLKPEPDSGLGGLVVAYIVATGWTAARRRDGTSGGFEIAACAAALGTGAVLILAGVTSREALTPVGQGPVVALGSVCVLAGLLDLNAILRAPLSPVQRISRHLWRMCFAFFIATGSFFLGQQDVMPAAVRGSPILLMLGFAPFAVMAYWLVRVRFAGARRRIGEALQQRRLNFGDSALIPGAIAVAPDPAVGN